MAYTIALYIHILGAIGLFVGYGVLYVSVAGMRRARDVETLRLWAGTVSRVMRTIFPITGLTILVAGLYMGAVAWQGRFGWMVVALAAFIGVAVVVGVIFSRGMRALMQSARDLPPDAAMPADLVARLHNPQLWITVHGALGLLAGIVYLMVAKPDVISALVVLAIGLAAGLSLGLARQRVARPVLATQA